VNVSELLVLEGLLLGKTLAQIGAELSVGESSVSRTLSNMERLIGLQIVDRQAYRLRLTPTGRDLAVVARRTAQQLRDFDQLIEQYRRGEQGRLRVLSSNSPANYLLPPVIYDFLVRFSQADLQLDVQDGHDLWRIFGQGQYDVAIGPTGGSSNLAASFLPDGEWISEPLYEDPVVLFISAANPLRHERNVTLQSLEGHIFIGTYGQNFWNRFRGPAGQQGAQGEADCRLEGVEGVKRMVEAGEGIGVHLKSAVAREVQDGQLVTLNVAAVVPPFRFVMVRRANEGQMSLVSAFCEFVRNRLPETIHSLRLVPRMSSQA
jgi:LysR family transcriptional regulator, transcriptional activator of the cysJI operon